MKLKQILLTSVGCLLSLTAGATETTKEYYKLPEEAKCKNNYCVDLENKPITGIIRRYRDGFLVREYAAKNGYLDGTSKAYYNNGKIKSERNYKMGRLDGYVATYTEEGVMVENVAYKDGKKEGISSYYDQNNIIKIIYTNGFMNGDAQIWDRNTGKIIYKLKMQNNELTGGTYFYQNNEKIEEKELTQLVIEGKNSQCLELQNNILPTSCMINIKKLIPLLSKQEELPTECNSEWFNQHKTELAKYTRSCKCNDLEVEIKQIYEDKEKDPTERKEKLLNLKEKYEKHCMTTDE